MTLAEQLKALKGKLNAENDLGGQKDTLKIAELEQQIADLNIQILAETQQTQTEAIAQAQEERIASITLPYDFNVVFDDPRANEMIVELIKEFQVEANEEYNAKLKDINAAHLEELRAATDRELQLKRQNDELQQEVQFKGEQSLLDATKIGELEEELKGMRELYEETQSKVHKLEFDIHHAESKRDAAVREKEGIELLLTEKQAQIEKLRDEIAIGAVAAVNVVEISPTDRLAKLIEESKQAKVKSALDIALENTAPFRGKVITDGQVVANLEAPQVTPFQPVNQTSDTSDQLVTGPVIDVFAENQPVDFILPATPSNFRPEGEVHSESSGLGESNAETSGESGRTLEEAFKRIEALEAKLGV